MRIPDNVLNEAFEERSPYVPRGMTKEDVRKLVSWIVERSIDYEALAAHLQDSDDDAGDFVASMETYRTLAHIYGGLLGIGGDDEK